MVGIAGFDATQYEDEKDFGPVPTGDYEVIAIDSEERQTKDGSGMYIAFTFEVQTDGFAGRRLWHNFNMVNKNPKAEQIGAQQLAGLCKAVGVLAPKDTGELHGIPLMVHVKLVDKNDGYGPKSEIKSFKKIERAAKTVEAAPADTSTPPWRRKG